MIKKSPRGELALKLTEPKVEKTHVESIGVKLEPFGGKYWLDGQKPYIVDKH